MSFTWQKFAEELLHGSLSGLSIVLISHPSDTLKTRKQIESFRYRDMIWKMVRKEGILSFYKGVLSPMMSMPMFKSVIFCAYKMSLVKIEQEGWLVHSRDLQVGLAGFISGFCNSFVCGPKDLFKVKLQIQKDNRKSYSAGYADIFWKT